MKKGTSSLKISISNLGWLYKWISGFLLSVKPFYKSVYFKTHEKITHMETLIEDRKGRPTFYISYTGF